MLRRNDTKMRLPQTERAVREAVAEERLLNERRWRQFFRVAGMMNPMTGEPFESYEEYEAAMDSGALERGRTASAGMKETIAGELREIQQLDPSIRSVEDLLRMPSAEAFRMYVRRGNSFLDAYILANRDRFRRNFSQEAMQQAMNRTRSKNHLLATTGRGAAALAEVPAEELLLFRGLMPESSDSEFRAYYNLFRE